MPGLAIVALLLAGAFLGAWAGVWLAHAVADLRMDLATGNRPRWWPGRRNGGRWT